MESTILDLKSPITDNSLVDIINWTKEGACVIIHNKFKYGRYFHPRCGTSDQDLDSNYDNLRVIYLDVSSMPGLLEDGEWNYYVKEKGTPECTCDLKKSLSNPNGWKHSVHLTLE